MIVLAFKFNYPITGSFDAQVDYVLLSLACPNGYNYERVALIITGGADNWYTGRNNDPSHGDYYYFTNGDAIPTPDMSGKLRITFDASTKTITSYYWNVTNTDWSQLGTPHTITYTDPVTLSLAIWGGSVDYSNDIRVAFDNFSIQSSSVPLPPSLLLLGSGLLRLGGWRRFRKS